MIHKGEELEHRAMMLLRERDDRIAQREARRKATERRMGRKRK